MRPISLTKRHNAMKLEVTPYHYVTELKDSRGLTMRDAGWRRDEPLIFALPDECKGPEFPSHVYDMLDEHCILNCDKMVVKSDDAECTGTYTWNAEAGVWEKEARNE